MVRIPLLVEGEMEEEERMKQEQERAENLEYAMYRMLRWEVLGEGTNETVAIGDCKLGTRTFMLS